MTEEVLRQLAMDSDSDMEPKNDDSLPDHGDDFVVESSNEAMLDEPVYFCMKKVWKVFNYQIIPLFNLSSFCCHDNATSN